ncbi:MAG: hypothetical protein U0228_35280 [Myxococcaceae bacterium]
MTNRTLTWTLLGATLVMVACGPPQSTPNHRLVSVTPTLRTVVDGVPIHSQLGVTPVWLDGDSTPVQIGDNSWRFTVNTGPALFQITPKEFVYSAAPSLRPCSDGFSLPGSTYVGATGGIPFDLVFAEPSSGAEMIHVRGAPVPWFRPDAGDTELHQVRKVAIERAGGPVTLTELTFEAGGTSARIGHAIAVADAGVLDPSAPAVDATFTSLSPGTPLTVAWDRPALTALLSGSNARDPGAMFVRVLQGQTWLAQVYDPTKDAQTLTVPMSSETPTHYEVWSNATRFQLDGEESDQTLSFAATWSGEVSLVPSKGGPARDVTIVDGTSVRWTAPSTPPGAYLVSFYEPSSALPVGTMFTDQVEVPIPEALRRPSLTVEVQALTGGGVTAASCPLDYKMGGAPWSQFVSKSP